MLQEFRNKLIAIIIVCNTLAVVIWDFFVVNGIRQRLATKKQKGTVKYMAELSAECGGENTFVQKQEFHSRVRADFYDTPHSVAKKTRVLH
jgi:hypothetical protein